VFSDSEPGAPAERLVRVLSVSESALVLGSTQVASVAGDAGVEVVRRRSGGGAVLLVPGETVWVDVVVPRDDPLWSDDVGRAFWWLGDVWAAVVGGSVHRGPLVRSRWSRDVCFAGVGPGEVVADGGGGGKVVGMAARRTRQWALFQCAVPLVWRPDAYVSLLGLPAAAVEDLAAVAAPVTVAADVVVDRFLAALP
jgi:lipoate-protein ligase A